MEHLDPVRSHDSTLSPAVAVRWWGGSRNFDLYWRYPAQGDGVHEDGTPLLRVSGTLNMNETRSLYLFLHNLLEGTEEPG